MAYTFKQNMVSSSKYSIKCPYTMTPQYITIHNTSNNASAENEVKYMINNNNQTSYHVAVDDKYVIQAIPFNRNAWHAGDGASGTGNRKSIGIEICYSTGNLETFKKAEANCAKYVATLLKQYGWTTAKVKRHKDWSGKNCPHKTMELGWDRFVKMIQKELDALNGKATTASDSKPSNTTTNNSSNTLTGSNFMVRIKVDSLNIRKSASLSATVMGTVKKGQVYTITKVTNGMGCLKSGAGWISMGTEYVEKISSVSSTSASNTEYKVKITANVLNVRAGAGATYKINTTVKKNQVFTIIETKNGWGKLKSGAGWIDLNYATKL